ncbi:MFS family (AraJ) [Fructobacillus cardui]|nr:MFS family (AraJ) [Fructobacillus cardui]
MAEATIAQGQTNLRQEPFTKNQKLTLWSTVAGFGLEHICPFYIFCTYLHHFILPY